MAAHTNEGQFGESLFFRFRKCERICTVGVARTSCRQHLFFGLNKNGLCFPLVVVFYSADESAFDVVVVEQPRQHGRYESTVLTLFMLCLVGGACEKKLFPNASHLIVFAIATKEVLVGSRLPRAESGARACARGAPLFAMDAVVEAKLFLQVEGLVLAFFVLIPNDIVWAGNNATCTPRAQTSVNDLFVEFFPLRCPALGLCGGIGCHRHMTRLGLRWHRLHVRPYEYGQSVPRW